MIRRRGTALASATLITIALAAAGPATAGPVAGRPATANPSDGCAASPMSAGPLGRVRAATSGAVEDVAANGSDDVWAVGEVGTRASAEHWDGSAWTPYRLPGIPRDAASVTASGIARVANDDVWVVGTIDDATGGVAAFSEHFDGTSWHRVALPAAAGQTSALASVSGTGPDDVWAVGSSFDPATCMTLAYVLHWDGSSWSTSSLAERAAGPAKLGNLDPVDVVAIAPDDAWLVGTAATARGHFLALSEHWNGTRWHVVNTDAGRQLTWLNSVTVTSGDNVSAVGARVTEIGRTLVEHNAGSGWTRSPSDDPSAHSYLLGVDAAGATSAWAVGFQGESGGTGLVERLTGNRWRSVSSPSDVAALISVAVISNADVWVGASSTHAGQPAVLEHWDGTGWTRIPFPS